MKRLTKAARFLAQFKMVDVTQCEFSVYVASENDKLESLCCAYCLGCDDDIKDRCDFREWTPQQFADSIADPDFKMMELKKAEIVAVRVTFKVTGDTNLYVLECTNFATMNRFDRLIIENCYKKTVEVYLTPKESQALQNTTAVVEYGKKIPAKRRAKYDGDLPIVMKNYKARHRRDGLIYAT